ncbi:zeta toxin family protein [Hydrogenophaga sp. UC242_50]|uniref:zeta toxin family protein n=1 Tax=unclassified Hydrogenophaga TaxID=2610897 RepID=UPI0036D33BE1
MTDEEKLISDTALVWARANKKSFARALADPQKYPGEAQPVSVFMAGSPGAGKTEVAKALTALFRERVLHIDPDDFRSALPGYNGKNSWLFQAAVSVLLGKVLDLAFEQKQSFLLDGTLSNMKTSTENVERAVKKGREVLLLYVYQEPLQAWRFVQAREEAEGRNIPPARFVDQFFGARDVVNELKVKFGPSVQVDVIFKDIDGKNRRFEANISDLNHAAPIPYSREDVERIVTSI